MRFREQWTRRLRGLYRKGMSGRDEHVKIEQAFDECAGQWMALDRKSGDVVAANSSPYELAAYIKSDMVKMGKIIKQAGIRAD